MFYIIAHMRALDFHYGGWKEQRVGRPRKYNGGWANVHRRLNVSNNTFAKWRKLRGELARTSDDAVAVFAHRIQNHCI